MFNQLSDKFWVIQYNKHFLMFYRKALEFMFLQQFYSSQDNKIQITAEQASLFAKEVAGDFNPLHDPDTKRFCVPGDLLFAIVLERYGLNQNMHFTFAGMVGHGVTLNLLETTADTFDINDDKSKTYLRIERSGSSVDDSELMKAFIENYVAFSGPNFPHVLVPMMAKQNVMINTLRPLVIYESMSFQFKHMNFSRVQIKASETELNVDGKRANALLHFTINDQDKVVGSGFKKLLMSGVRAYDHEIISEFTNEYLLRKQTYLDGMK